MSTADTTIGSRCLADTTANAVVPGSIKEDKSTVLQMFRIRLTDAGWDQ